MKSVMDVDEIDRIIKKIEMYNQLENINFDGINTRCKNANSAYNTDNKTKLEEIISLLKNNFNMVTKIDQDYRTVLEKNAIKYRSTSSLVKDNFDRLS